MRVAVLDDYLSVARTCANWSALDNAELTVFEDHLGDEDNVANALSEFQVIVAMRERTPFPGSLIERLPNLQLLITSGMRNNAIDMTVARARGIDVCGTSMPPFGPAFEHTWAMILALSKNLIHENALMHSGGWQDGLTEPLYGRTLGIIGLGKLGEKTARIALAFGMHVIAWSENLQSERAAEVGVVRAPDLDTLLKTSDIVSLHTILSERTRGLLGKRELELMKPSAFLVNTSRGPIVDENALVDALNNKTIAGAGIDVYDVEPLPPTHPLRACTSALLTGHTGYGVRDTFVNAYNEAVEDIKAWQAGSPLRVLNP